MLSRRLSRQNNSMALNLFGKKKSPAKAPRTAKQKDVAPVESTAVSRPMIQDAGTAHALLKHFYVSEKASRLLNDNQYVFKVSKDATKQSIKAAIAKMYKVAVKDVKMITLPKKRKQVGRYPGFRSGFRKAIVVLEKGNVIEQFKA